MTSKQDGNIRMSMSTEIFLRNYSSITDGLPNFATYFSRIQTTNADIQAAQQLQELDKTGITANKNQLKATLIVPAVDIARRMVAYATNVNNPVFLAKINYSESDLKRSSDTELKSRCQVIYDHAKENLGLLDGYGITRDNLVQLQTAIMNFNDAFPQRRVGTTDKKQATQHLADLFKVLADTYDRIDKLIEMVRISHPDFYNEYKNVRKVISTGVGSLVLKVLVTDAQTGEPLANTTLTITPDDGLQRSASQIAKQSVVRKTAKGGGMNEKSMEEGKYVVTAQKPGYKDKMITVSIVHGEMAVLEIALDKI
jgi:hypothetical protein